MRVITTCVLLALSVASIAQKGAYTGGGSGQKVDAKKFAGLEKAYKASKVKFEKTPKDVKARKAVAEDGMKYGAVAMFSDILPQKEKYKVALSAFRTVLKADPNNKQAKEYADMIISIYKSMNRPVPEG